jgi:predicted PurR-regulated permease PerM
MLGILIGDALAGLPGAFLAVPIAGALQVILAHLPRTKDAPQSEEHADATDRAMHEGQGAPLHSRAA